MMNKCETVYIAGPITKCPNYRENFLKREKELIAMGYRVFNPVTIGDRLQKQTRHQITHQEYMEYLLPYVLKADGISLLDGWEFSKGATVEKIVAEATGKTFVKVKLLDKSWNN